MPKRYISLVLTFLIFATFFGVVTWAQRTENETENEGVTLAALGVTAEQKAQIKALWKLKRQRHIRAIENLRPLNRLAKDRMASDDEIRETLKKFRQHRLTQEQKVEKAEGHLIKSLSPRAQLHLIILGVLDNGLNPRRLGAVPKKEESTQQSSSNQK